jgi:hypothetical protein
MEYIRILAIDSAYIATLGQKESIKAYKSRIYDTLPTLLREQRKPQTGASHAFGQTHTGQPSGKTYTQHQYLGQRRRYGTDFFMTFSPLMKNSIRLDYLRRIDVDSVTRKTQNNTASMNVRMEKEYGNGPGRR